MSRPHIPLPIQDLSTFSRALARQLSAGADAGQVPSHLALMNMLARAGGYRNFQHLRAVQAAEGRLARPPEPEAPVDLRLVEKALPHFDDQGRLLRWPGRRQVRSLCLQVLWARLPAGQAMTEAQVNALLGPAHAFGDVAQLRRSLVEDGRLTRRRDGSDYRRAGGAPSPEGRALIRLVEARRRAAA